MLARLTRSMNRYTGVLSAAHASWSRSLAEAQSVQVNWPGQLSSGLMAGK